VGYFVDMIALLQRVLEASVEVGTERAATIGPGLLVLIGVRPADDGAAAQKLLGRLLNYRIFSDAAGKMNLSLTQTGGGLLLVPQFTLAAETRTGLRPGFSTAAAPEHAKAMFDLLVAAANGQHSPVQTGVFGAHMRVSLINDGPATFWLES
jgi:D-tyrosyl-tRNA(Tyr) deacylase